MVYQGCWVREKYKGWEIRSLLVASVASVASVAILKGMRDNNEDKTKDISCNNLPQSEVNLCSVNTRILANCLMPLVHFSKLSLSFICTNFLSHIYLLFKNLNVYVDVVFLLYLTLLIYSCIIQWGIFKWRGTLNLLELFIHTHLNTFNNIWELNTSYCQ